MSGTTTLQVNVFRYNNSLSMSSMLRNMTLFLQTVRNVADDVVTGRNMSNITNLQISSGLLEQYNIRYTEKWVKRIDENFYEYYYGSRPSLNVPHASRTHQFSYIADKFFSGDVSGMIAESLFVYLLQTLGININRVAHLRPHKRKSAFMSDFAIWDRGKSIGSLITATNFNLPIYAEVKGSTGNIGKERIGKAINQLSQVITNKLSCGLVFLAFKNPNSGYKGVVLEVIY
ncbi:MAG: hypothetical protein QXZ70_00470 [Candidatus Bathyarchaeia archaeon]